MLMTRCLVCPLCGRELAEPAAETLTCASGHAFPIERGIPRLLPHRARVAGGRSGADDGDRRSIHASFSNEWARFDPDQDRVWGQGLEVKRRLALQELDRAPGDIAGKLALDAGCGPGVMTRILSDFGADVLAADLSDSVEAAAARFAARPPKSRVEFVQADATRPPFAPGAFDIVFCGGVLHHTRDTRQALERLVSAVAPDGSVYVWLYHRVPGLAHLLRNLMRRGVAPLPSRVKDRLVRAWVGQSMLRQEISIRRGRLDAAQRVSRNEKLVILLDHYTPRYRWEHTPEEVHGWFADLGFDRVKTTELSQWGFGVLAHRPAA